MKILTNKISGQAGGISRRTHEIGKYVNSHNGNDELIVIRMGNDQKLTTYTNGNVKEYKLPYADWQIVEPGKEKNGVPKQVKDIDSFQKFVADVIREIEKIIALENPSACLVQGAFYFPWCLALAAHSNGVPIVHIYCGSTQTEILDGEFKQAYYALEKEISGLSDITIFNSKKGKSFIQETFAREREYSDSPVIYNGFPVEYVALSNQIPPRVAIGWCGRNVAVKNIDYLFRIREYLSKDKYPIYAVTSPDLNSLRLREFHERGIRLLGQVEPEEMYKFYEKVSCVISTSYFEFFPNVIAEAIAAGRVPIVPTESGMSEILLDAGLGELVVNLENIEEVVSLITNSHEFLNQVREVGRKLTKDLSWENAIKKYLTLCGGLK